jgi:hypothetical protein
MTTTAHVVAAHHSESTDWLQLLRYPYTVCSKAGIPKNTPPNKGNESSSYLQWIVDNYDNLPDYSIFIHAHQTSPHSSGFMDERINTLTFDRDYCNINVFTHFRLDDFPHAVQLLHEHKQQIEEITNRSIVPENLVYRCCAQFYISRACIRQFTREQYQALLDWIMAFPGDHAAPGYILEWTWHVIFTGEHHDF